MHLQLQMAEGQKSSGKYIWYIGQQLEDLSLPQLFKSQQCHHSSEGNQYTPQYSYTPNDKAHADVMDNRAEIFDDGRKMTCNSCQ